MDHGTCSHTLRWECGNTAQDSVLGDLRIPVHRISEQPPRSQNKGVDRERLCFHKDSSGALEHMEVHLQRQTDQAKPATIHL